MSNANAPAPVSTDRAPAAIGPYSQGIVVGNLLFVSGQLPIDPATGAFAGNNIEEHTHQCLKNLRAVAEAAGTSLDRAVKVTVFMDDIGQFARMNQVYAQYFPVNPPARSAMQVAALPKNSDVEIEAIISL